MIREVLAKIGSKEPKNRRTLSFATASIALFLGSILLCSSTATPPTSGSVSSTSASYNGNALVLTGHVTLDHGLGKMEAEEAQLEKQEELSKDFPFRLIHLSKEVVLALKNNAQLKCERADLDFTTLKGFLTAKEADKVSYIDHIKRKGSKESSLKLLGQTLELSFLKQDHSAEKTEYAVESALARGSVEVLYGADFHLDADHALYRRTLLSQDKTSSKEFQGILTAYPKDDASKCHLTHGQDSVDADTVDIDLITSKLLLAHAQGTLGSSLLSQKADGKISFDCQRLVWDSLLSQLTLTGNITIIDPSFGKIVSKETLILAHQMLKDKKTLQTATSYGPTIFTYQVPGVETPYQLTCEGTVLLDRVHSQVVCESPVRDGAVLREDQVHYEDGNFSFYSDKAFCEYAGEEGGELAPTSFTLRGNVRLFSKDAHNKSSYGIADRLQYSPETHTLVLTAAPGKRVLFWDEVNKMSLSAKEVHILHDPQTKERTVQGVGNLRLTFDPSEHALFKQLFPKVHLNDE